MDRPSEGALSRNSFRVVAWAALGLAVFALVTRHDSATEPSRPRLYHGDGYSGDVGARDDAGFTAAKVTANWAPQDEVSISGQLQATSVLKGEGTITATLLVDGLSVASASATLGTNSVVTIPVQSSPTGTEGETHTVELVALFVGESKENIAIEGGQLLVTIFPHTE